MIKKIIGTIVFTLVVCAIAYAGVVVLNSQKNAGDIINAEDYYDNDVIIANVLNGNIDNSNIATGANINLSKIYGTAPAGGKTFTGKFIFGTGPFSFTGDSTFTGTSAFIGDTDINGWKFTGFGNLSTATNGIMAINAAFLNTTTSAHNDSPMTIAQYQAGSPIFTDISSYAGTTYKGWLAPKLTAYTDGMVVNARIGTTNTGAATLNLNGLGAVPIRTTDNNDVPVGALVANSHIAFHYNGTLGVFQYIQMPPTGAVFVDEKRSYTQDSATARLVYDSSYVFGKRVFNHTEYNNIPGFSIISSYILNIPKGRYEVDIASPSSYAAIHTSVLLKWADNTIIAPGTTQSAYGYSFIHTRLDFDSDTRVYVRHAHATLTTNPVFGAAPSIPLGWTSFTGYSSVYETFKMRQLP